MSSSTGRERLPGDEREICARLARRGFMGVTAGATLASLLGHEPVGLDAAPRQNGAAAGSRPKATADAVIVLWMAGGMASTETFDPKRYTPFAPGVPIKDVLSTFPAIDTKVDHIKFGQGLERIGGGLRTGRVDPSFVGAGLGPTPYPPPPHPPHP